MKDLSRNLCAYVVVYVACLALPACSNDSSRTSNPDTLAQEVELSPGDGGGSSAEKPCEQYSLGPLSYALSEVSIKLNRTGCYGSCPTYEVTVFGDGRVEYVGHDNVAEIGTRSSNTDRDAVIGLLDQLYFDRFLFMQPRYNARFGVSADESSEVHVIGFGGSADAPSAVVELHIGTFCKSVTAISEYPPELGELIERIDEVAGTGQWI